MQDEFIKAKLLIEKSQKILSISHKRPDGDTLGASCALYLALKQLGKKVDMACVDEIPERYQFLTDMNKVIHQFDFHDYDLILVSDAGASYMTNYHKIYPDIFKGEVPVINFDHHASNDFFGTINIVDTKAASATIILARFFEFCGYRITPAIATALLCGIYNDTGSLMHSNTSIEVFETSGKLMEKGGKIHEVARQLFRSTPISTLKLWGRVLENTHINDEGVTLSVITWKDFEDCNAGTDEISGVVDFLNSIPGSKFTILLNEDEQGNVKGSFRTQRDDVDLSALAGKFGGGGHTKAAGFTMQGRLQKEIRWKIVPDQKNLPQQENVNVNLPLN